MYWSDYTTWHKQVQQRPKSSANHQQLPSSLNFHIWDPSPTVRPSTCIQPLTFTQTHWHALNAQVLTTFLLHSCTRRRESINNPFEWDPVGFSVWNFEHPAIVLYSKTNFRSYPKWSVALTTLRTQKTVLYPSVCQRTRAFNGLQVPANKGPINAPQQNNCLSCPE